MKRKSREIPGDFKVSYHFIAEIAGSPSWHRMVCNAILSPYMKDIKEIHANKSMGHLSDDQLQVPVFAVDPVVQYLRHPFAMLYSLKNATDVPPALVERVAFRSGSEVGKRMFDPPPHLPTDAEALWRLYQSAFTVPKGYMANYTNLVGTVVSFLFLLLCIYRLISRLRILWN